ncbi:MAG: bifunctional riboflavin kinase/FAD synthetase [Clostridia bacterium]|nr:bifunctional riboflavin kinase/FAD synthetase [Clostridia bacterium]
MLISTACGCPAGADASVGKGEFAIALGCFDGVHIGHAELFRTLVEGANGKKRAVWTFAPPEAGKPCPVKGKPLIVPFDRKCELLNECGIEYAFLYGFSDVCSLSCEEFVDRILIGECGCGLAVCGYNFTFGRGAAGNAQTLKRLLAERGIEAIIVENVQRDGTSVSSAGIRAALAEGNVELAEKMLGREYTVTAPVIGGRRLGREWGFPTVNQHFFDGAAVPQKGVYASSCIIDGKKYGAVTNVGVRPTVSGGNDVITAETHIFDYSGDLYGKTLSVALKHFIRPEKKFENGDELRSAVLADMETARKYCSENI